MQNPPGYLPTLYRIYSDSLVGKGNGGVFFFNFNKISSVSCKNGPIINTTVVVESHDFLKTNLTKTWFKNNRYVI